MFKEELSELLEKDRLEREAYNRRLDVRLKKAWEAMGEWLDDKWDWIYVGSRILLLIFWAWWIYTISNDVRNWFQSHPTDTNIHIGGKERCQ